MWRRRDSLTRLELGGKAVTLFRSARQHDRATCLGEPAIAANLSPDDEGAARRQRLNQWLDTAWRRGWSQRPTLDPADLLRAAGGADRDFGDPDRWRPQFNRLCEGLGRDARLTPLGRTIAHGQIVAALNGRAAMQRLLARHPEIETLPIAPPIIIAGHMRGGTTRVQRLLAADPALAGTRLWESWTPVARSRTVRWARAVVGLGLAHHVAPTMRAVHPTEVGAIDEEFGYHALSLWGSLFEAQYRLPDYARWCENADARGVYADFATLLRIQQWQRGMRPGDTPRPWVLKLPQLVQDLPTVLQALPEARLVLVTRERGAVVASAASLVATQRRTQSDAVDLHEIGADWSRKVALREERLAQARSIAKGAGAEVDFAELDADWEAAVERLYAGLGLTLGDTARAAMRRYVRKAEREPRHRHRYRPADFGLAPA